MEKRSHLWGRALAAVVTVLAVTLGASTPALADGTYYRSFGYGSFRVTVDSRANDVIIHYTISDSTCDSNRPRLTVVARRAGAAEVHREEIINSSGCGSYITSSLWFTISELDGYTSGYIEAYGNDCWHWSIFANCPYATLFASTVYSIG